MWGDIATSFLLAFIISFVVTPYTIRLAKKKGAIDYPNDRRVNKMPVARLGGIAVITGFIISVVYLIVSMALEGKFSLIDSQKYGMKLLGFLIAILVLAVVSYIDDIKDVKPLVKLLAQIIAACILFGFGVRIENIGSHILHPALSFVLTIGWIIGVTNAINLIDGLDGLSSGITLISSLALLIIFATNDSSTISMILITALAGSITGFLPFNVNPAKTFIGDVGSQFLGLSLATISIFGVAKTVTLVVLLAPILVLALPIMDTLWAIVRRTAKGKSFKAIFQADRGHLHHKLVDQGFTQKQAVTIMYVISAALGMFAIILIYEGVIKAFLFLAFVTLVLLLGLSGIKQFKEDLIRDNKDLGLVDKKEKQEKITTNNSNSNKDKDNNKSNNKDKRENKNNKNMKKQK